MTQVLSQAPAYWHFWHGDGAAIYIHFKGAQPNFFDPILTIYSILFSPLRSPVTVSEGQSVKPVSTREIVFTQYYAIAVNYSCIGNILHRSRSTSEALHIFITGSNYLVKQSASTLEEPDH